MQKYNVARYQVRSVDNLFGAVAQAAGQIKARDFEAARKSIVDLGATLQRLATEAAPAPPADGAREAFRRRQGELEPQLLAAQRAAPDQATALGNVWQYADDQAREGNLANADKALDRLADAVRKTLAAAPQELVAKGTVHAAKVMLTTWKSALAEARGEIDKLGQSIRVQLAQRPTAKRLLRLRPCYPI